MTEPTGDEIARWAELTMSAMPGPWVNYERAVYEDRGILHRVARTDMLADAEFIAAARTAVPRLLALVAAQAEQIAELEAAQIPGDFRPTVQRMRRAEQAVARVRALCDEYEAAREPDGGVSLVPAQWAGADFRRALDGTGATP